MDHLTSMRVFVRVVEAGSFAKTADQLEMSRAMVTTHVAALERKLAVRLINRTTRRLSLTEDGRAYYERCVRILEDVEEAEGVLSRSRTVARGRLRVEMPIAFARYWVIPSLPRFLSRHPELTVEIGLNNRMMDLSAEGFDCAVRTGTPPDSSLVARRIGLLDWVTCAAPGYLRRHGTPKDPEHLLSHNCIVWLSAQTMRAVPWHYQNGEVDKTIEVKGNLALNAMEDAAAAAEAGIGIARTLRRLAQPGLREGRLTALLEGWSSPPQPISIVYPHSRYLSAKVRVFADFLVRALESGPRDRRRRGARSSAAAAGTSAVGDAGSQ
jgi:LysR family transcriptional regulator for bpeEF and oprC